MIAALKTPLGLRIASAAVLMPVVLGIVIFGTWSFLGLMITAAMLSLYEWCQMMKGRGNLLRLILGIVYILICFGAFIYNWKISYGSTGPAMALFLCVWASDIGAYFTGKTIGGPKMAPGISPNKTWSGLIGGMFLSGVTLVFYFQYLGWVLTDLKMDVMHGNGDPSMFMLAFMPQIMENGTGPSVPVVFCIGAAIAIVGQIGDLIESSQKRKVGVKDSGNLIPGHGGILDRIDALLLAAPFFLIVQLVL